ncbi:MAG: ORF6N domain-containing protein [Steroidobacteraceae bacterium]
MIGTNRSDRAADKKTITVAQAKRSATVPTQDISRAILVLRGQRVLLDAELAALYGVETRTLIQAVQRNRTRFPNDFMFQLSVTEWEALRSQIVISKAGRGGHLPTLAVRMQFSDTVTHLRQGIGSIAKARSSRDPSRSSRFRCDAQRAS